MSYNERHQKIQAISWLKIHLTTDMFRHFVGKIEKINKNKINELLLEKQKNFKSKTTKKKRKVGKKLCERKFSAISMESGFCVD